MNNQSPMADINTTPLVDVMLVLLIIFMITAPMMQRHARVKIPLVGPPNALRLPPPPKSVLFEMAADGTLRWEGNVTSFNAAIMQSKALAQSLASTGSSLRIYLRNDPNARYERVVQLLSKLTEAGLSDIRFAEISPMPSEPSASR